MGILNCISNMSEATEDRISNLPDSLIHHILAFLHIRDCARASVLSRRWNYIWTTVPTLYFQKNRKSLQFPPHYLSQKASPSETKKFMDFVDGTLHRRNSSTVDEFTLIWSGSLNETRVHSWMTNIIRGQAKVVRLYLRKEFPSCIPLSLFTGESLTLLELGGLFCDFTFPRRISFPRLRHLKLRGFIFWDECWNEELFSNFHVLEELILEKCQFNFTFRNFCISIPTLKLLKIDAWEPADSLLDSDNVAKENVLSSFPALVEAHVVLYSKKDVAALSRLLRAIAHVKFLTVSDLTLMAFRSAYDLSNKMLKFHNVKMLTISDNLATDQGLIALLNAAPNLDSLVFTKLNDAIVLDSDADDKEDSHADDKEDSHEEDNYKDGSDEDDSDEEDESDDGNEDDSLALDIVTNGCLFPHLKSVSFQKFVGDPRELRWVKLILKTADALQMVTVSYKAKSEKDFEAEISKFPRASPGSVIKFCPY